MKYLILFFTLLAFFNVYAESNVAERKGIYTFEVGQEVFHEDLGKGIVVDVLGNCHPEVKRWVVEFSENLNRSFCGSNEIGPVVDSFSYKGFHYQKGDKIVIEDTRAPWGTYYSYLGPFKIEELLIGAKPSNADPDRLLILRVTSEAGKEFELRMNYFYYPRYRITFL